MEMSVPLQTLNTLLRYKIFHVIHSHSCSFCKQHLQLKLATFGGYLKFGWM